MVGTPAGEPVETLTVSIAPAGALFFVSVIELEMPLTVGSAAELLCVSDKETVGEPGAGWFGRGTVGATPFVPPPPHPANAQTKTKIAAPR